ncbi:MAG: hypothetical protein KF802_03630 [Bdellovibrionaceae bacterium]|nr:hypothetical protein [Pseudobdellovibrionaceae bacterium]MBX3033287.1 hypothetical protein [Pseudobdellovibrionaceae bacterium]
MVSYITAALMLGCGYADNVIQYIEKTIPERASHRAGLRGRQGERFRMLRSYSDGSWFLTYEFFTSGPVEEDITCIVAHGADEEFHRVPLFRIRQLPEGDIGTPVPRPVLRVPSEE